MNVLRWFTGHFSNRGKAMSLYRRGMTRSKSHDHPGAIEDYTTAIDMRETPSDIKAMALYNRALVYAAAGDGSKATTDLNAVLGMSEALPNIKAEAKRKLARMQSKSAKADS